MPTDAKAAAEAWLAAPGEAPAVPFESSAERVALAWALKDIGYEALQRQLPLAATALQRLQALAHAAAADEDSSALLEIGAALAWLEGARCALGGEAPQAVARLDDARRALLSLGRAHAAAACQVPKLIALALLGRHDEALACAERTHDELVAAGDEAGAGRVEINLGSMLLRQHRYADAARWYRQAAVRFARVQDRRHSVMADIGLAGALAWQGEPDEAERIYERAGSRIRAHGLEGLAGIVDSSRGLLAMRRGRHAQALRYLASALAAFERDGPPQRLAEARRELADAYLALNLLPEAVALYEQAIAACIERQAPLEQAWATMQRSRALARQGRGAEAAQGLAQARALFEANGNAVGAARAVSHAAELSLQAGAAQRALRLARHARDALGAAGMAGWRLEAQVLEAEALAATGDLAAGSQAHGAVLADAGVQPELAQRSHAGLGHVALREGRLSDARRAFEQAAGVVEQQRASLQADEFRIAYGSDKAAAFEGLLGLALQDGSEAGTARLFETLERARGGALREGLRSPGTEPGLGGERRRQLQWLQGAAQAAAARGDGARAAELAAQQPVLEAQMLEALRRDQAAVTAQAPAPPQPPLQAAELQAALRPDEAFVMYCLCGAQLFALVLRRERLQRIDLDGATLADRVAQLRFQIDTLRFGAPALRRHGAQMLARCRVHLQALHRQLWAPLLPLLQGVRQVVVVPQGPLHYVPFCALDDGEQALLDRYALTLAPGAAAWLARRRAPLPPPRRALALGLAGSALPHVAAEVQQVAASFDGAGTVLLDADATLPALKAALPGADVLHLACHGRFRDDSPAFSALDLADGPLTLRDAAALPLAGLRVALSACETGLGRIAPGEELVGLVRGFLMAGAGSVLATLWTVDDASTAALMARYYAGLRAGEAESQALRAAQRAVRESHPHPYHWAPFVVHGAG
jgi:CHAT domain-containing protein/tetratricopeptide (TPR) repeat protein